MVGSRPIRQKTKLENTLVIATEIFEIFPLHSKPVHVCMERDVTNVVRLLPAQLNCSVKVCNKI